MRKIIDLFRRTPFDDYDRFDNSPATVKESQGDDLSQIGDKELVVNDNNELLIRRKEKVFKISGAGTQGEDGKNGLNGSNGLDGANAYLYIAYASDDSGTDFTMTFDANLDYIAILNVDEEIETPEASDFAGLWKKYKGETGTGGGGGFMHVEERYSTIQALTGSSYNSCENVIEILVPDFAIKGVAARLVAGTWTLKIWQEAAHTNLIDSKAIVVSSAGIVYIMLDADLSLAQGTYWFELLLSGAAAQVYGRAGTFSGFTFRIISSNLDGSNSTTTMFFMGLIQAEGNQVLIY